MQWVPTGGSAPSIRYLLYQPVMHVLYRVVWPYPSSVSSRALPSSCVIRLAKSYRVAGS